MSYTDITSDGGLDPRNDQNSNEAIIGRHQDYFRAIHPDTADAALREAGNKIVARKAFENCQFQLQVAIRHLHAILNESRTATESWQAEQEARQWLLSIGSEPR